MDIEHYQSLIEQFLSQLMHWLSSPKFYSQIGLIILALLIGLSVNRFLRNLSPLLRERPTEGPILQIRQGIFRLRELILPLMLVLSMSVAADISQAVIGQAWLVKLSLSLAVIFMLYTIITRFVEKQLFRKLAL